ncbi:MAG: lamin tail domain-containing protein, partial [Chloroflexi bacterium]|nr:lamin tail domain-containing protein [Chloroflexota bacterium]
MLPHWKQTLALVSLALLLTIPGASATHAPALAADTPTPTATFHVPSSTLTPTPTPTWNVEPGTPTPTPTSTRSPTNTPTPTPTAQASNPGDVVINEVQPDPPQSGSDAAYEWLELFNRTSQPIVLSGWTLADNTVTETLPTLTLPPGAFAVVAGRVASFAVNFPGFGGLIVEMPDGTIGNGLGNTGDRLLLRDSRGVLIDALSYGDNTSVFDPPCPAVAAGHSLERRPAGYDTDRASDFVDNPSPSPGQGLPALPTATPTPSSYPDTVVLNEFLAAPHATDWNSDGKVDSDDEWIELYNRGSVAVDLGGWQLDDVAEGGSKPYTLPPGSNIAPQSFLLFFGQQTNLTLNNDGDSVRLLWPTGHVMDSFTYTSAKYDQSYSRTEDGGGTWTQTYPPSPGQPNRPAPTPTPGPTKPPPTPSVLYLGSIAEARALPTGRRVSVQGQATVNAGVFGDQDIYIQDDTAGILVHLRSGSLPS